MATLAIDPLRNYVLYDQAEKSVFNVQPEDQYEGPSPFAKEAIGPSVLSNYTPKKASGVLDSTYHFSESTPSIGRVYYDADLKDILNDKRLLSDLAITVAERGVVFFKKQDITVEEQKELVHLIGVYAGKPETSGLHIHPTALAGGWLNGEKIDPTITLISSQLTRKLYSLDDPQQSLGPTIDSIWHSDITFEPAPSDFSTLRIVETPSKNPTEADVASPGGGPVGGSGGDTLWASGYALAERVSPQLLAFLETLTGEFSQPKFKEATAAKGVPLYTAARGAPENIGDELLAYHPVVRTNPTTGWKSIFALGGHFKRFVGLSYAESNVLKDYLQRLLLTTPEIQVRYKWDVGDIAIWDNRSTYHSAIYDLGGVSGNEKTRTGIRTVSIGERPFYDPNSKLRHEALGES